MKAPPPSRAVVDGLTEAAQRSRAVPVYRVLRAARDRYLADPAVPPGLHWDEIVREAGLFTLDEAIGAVTWMRGRGVRIVVVAGKVPGEHALVTLVEPMPEAFEGTLSG